MKIFSKPNLASGWKCPICKTSEEKEVVLIIMPETIKEDIGKAEQFHLDCIELSYYSEQKVILQNFN